MTKGIIFPKLPLNTQQVYVRGICQSGCEIWIPAINEERGIKQQQVLQNFLNNQPSPEKDIA